MEQLEVLTEVQDLRKVWPHEALDFTPWLAKDENIAILGNEIGMEIAVDGTESAVGDFSVDIIATDIATGQKVISKTSWKIPTTTIWANLSPTLPGKKLGRLSGW